MAFVFLFGVSIKSANNGCAWALPGESDQRFRCSELGLFGRKWGGDGKNLQGRLQEASMPRSGY